MTAELKFITLDDKTHVVGFSEHTACGLVIPIGETLTYDEPSKLCSQCSKLIDDSDEYGVLKSVIEEGAPKPLGAEPQPPAEEPADEPAKSTKEATPEKASGAKA